MANILGRKHVRQRQPGKALETSKGSLQSAEISRTLVHKRLIQDATIYWYCYCICRYCYRYTLQRNIAWRRYHTIATGTGAPNCQIRVKFCYHATRNLVPNMITITGRFKRSHRTFNYICSQCGSLW